MEVIVIAFNIRSGRTGMKKTEPRLLFSVQIIILPFLILQLCLCLFSFCPMFLLRALSVSFTFCLSASTLIAHFSSPLTPHLPLSPPLSISVGASARTRTKSCQLHHHRWPTWLPAQEQLSHLLCLPRLNNKYYCTRQPHHILEIG